ncbi:hypothetical protein DNTS_030190 [Danionella cerebrum]|uniref:Golgin subfamily A member 7/ERF4 domain-containing protein n=1 Tax=Danionella cerebrum TaxID=2873325 RepID=A0A553Q848_9TELE|nr:hypothetical protein DNTS_030190 [Danionella translucida]
MHCVDPSPLDGSQVSSDRMELAPPPFTDSTSDQGGAKVLTFDLLNMVVSFKRMGIFLEPVTDTLEVLRYLLGWRMPLYSMMSCCLLNILFLTLSEGAWFCLLLLTLLAPAGLGYLGDRCKGASSELSLQKKKHHSVQRRELKTVHMSEQEAMLEVKDMLKQIDDLLTQACERAESVYKVLYWESHAASSTFYGSLLMAACVLYSLPLGLSLSVLNSALFLWNRHFCRVLLELRERVHPTRVQTLEETELCDSEQTALLVRTPTSTSLEDLSPGNVEEAEEAEPDDEFKDAIEDDDDSSSGLPECDCVSDNGLLSRNEPIRSKVSKLTEKLRKRVPSNATAFSVLKKRRNCSNCGVSFCSRCCSYKVLRSTMGATAPEAQRETVFVCLTCNTRVPRRMSSSRCCFTPAYFPFILELENFHNLQELRHSASLANKVFIQRDYTDGTICKFQTKFPSELDSRIERTLFEDTVKTLNNYYAEAEKIGGQSYVEGCLACLTVYLIFLCIETSYEKVLKKISRYIQDQNEKVYGPRGLLITDPIERGMRVIEISVYEDRGSSGSSSGSSTTSSSGR